MNSANYVSENFSEANIDFDNNNSILAIFDDIKHNGGHGISIKNIVENKNNLVVAIGYLNFERDLTSVITQPFQRIKIPKTVKPILFEYEIIKSFSWVSFIF